LLDPPPNLDQLLGFDYNFDDSDFWLGDLTEWTTDFSLSSCGGLIAPSPLAATEAPGNVSSAPDGIFDPFHSILSPATSSQLPPLSPTRPIVGNDIATLSSGYLLETPKDGNQPALIPGEDLATRQSAFCTCSDCGGRFRNGQQLV